MLLSAKICFTPFIFAYSLLLKKISLQNVTLFEADTFILPFISYMKRYRNTFFYIAVIVFFSFIIYFVIANGASLEAGKTVAEDKAAAAVSSWEQFKETLADNIAYPLAILLLQIITIIVVARIFGFLCRKIGQPSVIGEIIAGIFLGPSFIGAYFPEFSAFIFPASSLGNLSVLSQIGLVLFMFVVGMELDLKILKNQAHEAVVISHASIIFPFALGIILAYFIYQGYAPEGVKFISFSLFIGIAMSITAFPVLARIVQERNLNKTRLGSIVITCAAADDITAWCLLAAVIAIVKAGSFTSSLYTILLATGYVIVMIKLVRPFLQHLGDIYSTKEGLSKPIVAVFFIALLLSAWSTEIIGIHALFGAFMAGVIMPPNMNFRNIFIEKVEDVALVLLLPLFFVFTGLRTEIGLLNDPSLWKVCGWIILVAVTGKFIGSAVAARFVGQNWTDSFTIGALMNTRGLMELVVLNIGYDLGVLSPEIFAMMVIMALATTFMTGPALDLINKLSGKSRHDDIIEDAPDASKYNILVSFGHPDTGRRLLRLANNLVSQSKENTSITAMHLSPGTELNQFNAEEYEQESFAPIKNEALILNQPIISLFKPVQDIDQEIAETANHGNYDLLLVGMGRSVFKGTLLGKILGFTTRFINPERLYDSITGKENFFEASLFDERTKRILRDTKIPVGVLVDKEMEKIDNIFVLLFSPEDAFLLDYVQKSIYNGNVNVTVLDVAGSNAQNPAIQSTLSGIRQTAPGQLAVYSNNKITKELLDGQDLLLISLESWKAAIESHSIWLSDAPSVLILKE